MSYILDALQRANAERERGQVPGLRSQTGTPGTAATPTDTGQTRRVVWAAGATVLLLALAAVVLVWVYRAADAPVTPSPSASATPPPSTSPTAPSSALPTTATAASPAPTLAPTPQATAAPPVPARNTPASPLRTPAAPPPILAPAPAPTPAAITAPASPRSPTPPVKATAPRLVDLSPEQRAHLPPLNVNGASYSANPAHRLLIVNGVVAHEGQEVAPDLKLERIGLHGAVFSHRGMRFTVDY